MIAFHGDEKVRAKYLDRVRRHRKAGQILQRYDYWKDGKGCAVGCTIHGSSHKAYETELGIPQIIAWLEDRIFERLPEELAREWPTRLLSSIKCGADLSMVWPAFAEWLLINPGWGIIRLARTVQVRSAITGVSSLYQEWLRTGVSPTTDRWIAAYAAADAAAAYAAADAAYATADAAAAYAAADAAAYAAAAYAAYAAADAAARREFWAAASDKLVELLSTSPVNKEQT